ncbi:hypothetical protein CSQ88_09900 [Iodobacter sp. BJB302]|nr:hypothetical protein CSQ88_09900 [Iodobacter sp. BJB302]
MSILYTYFDVCILSDIFIGNKRLWVFQDVCCDMKTGWGKGGRCHSMICVMLNSLLLRIKMSVVELANILRA